MKLKDGICHNCVLKDKGGQTLHLFSAENKMDPGIVPAHLPALTQIEEMVIARCYGSGMLYLPAHVALCHITTRLA
jgi:hypothetical protein